METFCNFDVFLDEYAHSNTTVNLKSATILGETPVATVPVESTAAVVQHIFKIPTVVKSKKFIRNATQQQTKRKRTSNVAVSTIMGIDEQHAKRQRTQNSRIVPYNELSDRDQTIYEDLRRFFAANDEVVSTLIIPLLTAQNQHSRRSHCVTEDVAGGGAGVTGGGVGMSGELMVEEEAKDKADDKPAAHKLPNSLRAVSRFFKRPDTMQNRVYVTHGASMVAAPDIRFVFRMLCYKHSNMVEMFRRGTPIRWPIHQHNPQSGTIIVTLGMLLFFRMFHQWNVAELIKRHTKGE